VPGEQARLHVPVAGQVSPRSGSGRHGGAGQAASGVPVRVVEVAEQVTSHLVGLPLDYGSAVDSIAALLTAEPRNHAHVRAVVSVIVADAMADPFRETHANRWRPLLPNRTHGQMVGATTSVLCRAGVLARTGRYVRSTDVKGRNTNKFCPIYTLDLAALTDAADVAGTPSAAGA
jgi:hypothetical protein